jgi:outer membrane lipoprotein carrier protein
MSEPHRLRPLLFALVVLLGLAAPLAARPTAPEELVGQVQKKYQQLRSLEFDFAQATRTGGRTRQGSGNAVFYRPGGAGPERHGVIRWNYTGPTEQTIVNDGRELSVYTPRDRQLLVSPAGEMEADITYALFTGAQRLLDAFTAAPADPEFQLSEPPADSEAVLLTPLEEQSQLKRLQLWLAPDRTIRRLLLEDHFGALTELTFTAVRFDRLEPGDLKRATMLRRLDLAPDTEIIRQ